MNIQIIQHQKTPSESIKRLLDKLSQETKTLSYGKAVSKLDQYKFFKENNIPHPDWTEDFSVALDWHKKGEVIVVREKIKSSQGQGLLIIEPNASLPDTGKVYTKYLKKKREFRVNLFRHEVINIREKVKEKGKQGSFYIRNKANGFTTTYCVSPPPKGIEDLAIKASKVSESDFIGVDIGYNEFKNLLFILEVNSGPSIEGSSVTEFANKIKETYNV